MTHDRRRRIFIFFPGISERTWRVLVPGSAVQAFSSEGRAVEFALMQAVIRKPGEERLVDVLKETPSGTWMPVPMP